MEVKLNFVVTNEGKPFYSATNEWTGLSRQDVVMLEEKLLAVLNDLMKVGKEKAGA